MRLSAFVTLVVLCLPSWSLAVQPPLKVFILAGQSNMEGHARVETFAWLAEDPVTAPLLAQMVDADGRPKVCEQVWISYLTGDGETNGVGSGRLTAGFGSRDNPAEDGGKIGPEFTFGLTMEAALQQPVLIIKTAWGGKSLNTDFRPPGAGPYELNDFQKKLYYGPPGHGVPEDMEQWLAEKEKATGHCYRLMIEHVRSVLQDLPASCPEYKGQGYELAGFVWFQGFNDMVDGHTYPEWNQPGRFDLYSSLMAQLIRDVRKDLQAPQLPVVIGVMGVDGLDPDQDNAEFRKAMAAPAQLPEFQGNVAAVQTAPFWPEELAAIDDKRQQVDQMGHFLRTKHKDHANADGNMSEDQQRKYLEEFEARLITEADRKLWEKGASNGGYHYFGCAKTLAQIGKALAEANLGLMKAAAGQ